MAEEKRYYWLKLAEDFYEDDTIQWIEEQENGVAYVNFYLKLLLKSLKDDGYLIRFVGTRLIPYDVKSLSRLTNTDPDTVRVAMELFRQVGLVEMLDSGEIYMSQIDEMIGSETQAAKRMRKLRAKEALEDQGLDDKKQLESKRNNVTNERNKVQKCYTEYRDRDIELESRDKSKKDDDSWKTQILSAWNSLDKNIPKIKSLNAGTDRHKLTKARINEYGIEAVLSAIRSIDDSQFLKGYKTDFVINYDWFIRPNNFVKVRDGNYIDRSNPNSYRSDSRYSEADTDISDLEAKLDRISKL